MTTTELISEAQTTQEQFLRQIMVRSEPLWDFSEVRRSFLNLPANESEAGGQIAHAKSFG